VCKNGKIRSSGVLQPMAVATSFAILLIFLPVGRIQPDAELHADFESVEKVLKKCTKESY
jgi:hypothetical protein